MSGRRRGEPRPAPVPLSAILGDLAGRRRWTQRLADSEIVGRWEDIVGATVAARTRVVRLAGGVLVVGVTDPAWATELRFLEREIVARADAVLGAGRVRSVHFVTESTGPPPKAP